MYMCVCMHIFKSYLQKYARIYYLYISYYIKIVILEIHVLTRLYLIYIFLYALIEEKLNYDRKTSFKRNKEKEWN